MVAGAAGLALVSAGTLSASRAHQAFNGLGSAASADVVTLTLGCSPTDLLSLLPFEPKSWTKAEVGVKFVSSAISRKRLISRKRKRWFRRRNAGCTNSRIK